MNDYKELYETNADFRRFVDKAMNDHGWTLEEALECKTLQDVGDYYRKNTSEKITKIEMNAGCGGC